MKRLVYLDALRGVAILLMVIDHAYDWWLNEASQVTRLAGITEFLGTLSAPLFLYLAGVGLALSAQRSAQAQRPRRAVVYRLLRRGGELVLWGYGLNLLIFFAGGNVADLFAVDILQTIGVCIWFAIPLLWASEWVAAAAALFVVILGQTAGQWELPSWVAAYLTGTKGIGYFPVALWLPYCYVGLAAGKRIGRGSRPMITISVAGLLALLATPLMNATWGYRHPRPLFLLFSLAVTFWSTAALWLWTEHLGRIGSIMRSLRDMGATSLMLYVFHHLVGYRVFWLLGWVRGRSSRGEYGVFDPVGATACLVGLLGLMALAAPLWLRWRAKEAS